MTDSVRNYALESSNATNPIPFEPMVIAILWAQQRRIMQLECKLKEVLPEKPEIQQNNPGNIIESKP